MGNEMTPRERLTTALNHEEPDRTPIDFASNYNTSVNVVAYNRLKQHLDIRSPTYMRYMGAMLAAADLDQDLEVIKLMGGDILPVPRYWTDGVASRDWKPWTLRDGSQCMVPGKFNPIENENGDLEMWFGGVPTFRMPKDGHYFDRIHSPLAGVENVKQLEELAPMIKTRGLFRLEDEELEILENWAARAYDETDYALLGDPYTLSLYQTGLESFGYNKFYMLMATDPEFVHYWMNLITEGFSEFLTKYLHAIGKYIAVVLIGDDYGSQKGPQMSPKMFRELFKPYLARICDPVPKTAPNGKVLLHCCGSIVPLIPEFIEAGVDALNPIQTTAQDMDPAMLKREFGNDIVLWGGGVSAQTTLFSGTVEDVRKEVRERLHIFKPGGGYVFTTDHDIQEHVAPEKIVAVYEAAQEFGKY